MTTPAYSKLRHVSANYWTTRDKRNFWLATDREQRRTTPYTWLWLLWGWLNG